MSQFSPQKPNPERPPMLLPQAQEGASNMANDVGETIVRMIRDRDAVQASAERLAAKARRLEDLVNMIRQAPIRACEFGIEPAGGWMAWYAAVAALDGAQ